MLTVTERAANKVLAIATKEGRAPILRLGVKGGGCAGFSYVIDFIDFVDVAKDIDQVLSLGGATFVVDPKSLEFLDEVQFDYESNLMAGGFKFHNPKAKKSCGCGESFST